VGGVVGRGLMLPTCTAAREDEPEAVDLARTPRAQSMPPSPRAVGLAAAGDDHSAGVLCCDTAAEPAAMAAMRVPTQYEKECPERTPCCDLTSPSPPFIPAIHLFPSSAPALSDAGPLDPLPRFGSEGGTETGPRRDQAEKASEPTAQLFSIATPGATPATTPGPTPRGLPEESAGILRAEAPAISELSVPLLAQDPSSGKSKRQRGRHCVLIKATMLLLFGVVSLAICSAPSLLRGGRTRSGDFSTVFQDLSLLLKGFLPSSLHGSILRETAEGWIEPLVEPMFSPWRDARRFQAHSAIRSPEAAEAGYATTRAPSSSTTVHVCKAQRCDTGRCNQRGCMRPHCDGGHCQQAGSSEPSCGGGACDQTEALRPTCGGGACRQTRTAEASCSGGNCEFAAFFA
jgi:hypothetical protein